MSSTSRFSKSRCNVPSENASSLNLLHSGIKRKVSRQEYTKLFTKMRISSKLKLPHKQDLRSAELQGEVLRLRQEIAALEAKNGDLRGKISKEHKIDGILAKKLENVEATDLDLNRAFEIKLILEVERLEDCLLQKTQELDMQVRQLKEKQLNVVDDYTALLDVTAILLRDASLGSVLQQREQSMKQCESRLALLRDKTKKMKEVKKIHLRQLQQLQVFLDQLKEKLPNLNASTKDENNSSIYSTQVRAVTIQSLQRQIHQLKHQTEQFQAKIQQLMQEKVKEKIVILKKIHEKQENPTVAKRRSKKELLW